MSWNIFFASFNRYLEDDKYASNRANWAGKQLNAESGTFHPPSGISSSPLLRSPLRPFHTFFYQWRNIAILQANVWRIKGFLVLDKRWREMTSMTSTFPLKNLNESSLQRWRSNEWMNQWHWRRESRRCRCRRWRRRRRRKRKNQTVCWNGVRMRRQTTQNSLFDRSTLWGHRISGQRSSRVKTASSLFNPFNVHCHHRLPYLLSYLVCLGRLFNLGSIFDGSFCVEIGFILTQYFLACPLDLGLLLFSCWGLLLSFDLIIISYIEWHFKSNHWSPSQ